MIKAMYFPTNSMPTFRRDGVDKVLALAIDIDTAELSAETGMSFRIEEMLLSSAKRLFAETNDGPVFIALDECGKPVSGRLNAMLAELISKKLPVIDLATT